MVGVWIFVGDKPPQSLLIIKRIGFAKIKCRYRIVKIIVYSLLHDAIYYIFDRIAFCFGLSRPKLSSVPCQLAFIPVQLFIESRPVNATFLKVNTHRFAIVNE